MTRMTSVQQGLHSGRCMWPARRFIWGPRRSRQIRVGFSYLPTEMAVPCLLELVQRVPQGLQEVEVQALLVALALLALLALLVLLALQVLLVQLVLLAL